MHDWRLQERAIYAKFLDESVEVNQIGPRNSGDIHFRAIISDHRSRSHVCTRMYIHEERDSKWLTYIIWSRSLVCCELDVNDLKSSVVRCGIPLWDVDVQHTVSCKCHLCSRYTYRKMY